MLAGHRGDSASTNSSRAAILPCCGSGYLPPRHTSSLLCAGTVSGEIVGRKSHFPSPSANKNLGAALADGDLNFPQLVYRLEKN